MHVAMAVRVLLRAMKSNYGLARKTEKAPTLKLPPPREALVVTRLRDLRRGRRDGLAGKPRN